MKNKKIQILIIAILAIGAAYLTISNRNGSIKKELRDFAVEDTSSVDKIFLVDKLNQTILLERQQGYWTVNEKHEARQDLVDLILKTLHRIKVKEPVSKAAHENVIKNLAVKSTKVEIYQNGKLSKTIYIGGPTKDSYGTYMMLENSSRPFIMEIPGFRGYLSTRFSTHEIEWRTQSIFRIPLKDLASVTIENHRNIKESFTATHNQNYFELFDYNNKKIPDFDTIKVKKFLMEFRQKNFNKYIEDVPEKWQDSIRESEPMYVITIEKSNGTKQWTKAFNKPGWGKVDFFDNELESDPDNFFMLMDNNDFVYAQYFTFDPIFKKISDFKKE